MRQQRNRPALMLVAGCMIAVGGATAFAAAPKTTKPTKPSFRGVLGEGNSKIKRENGKTFIWASGARDSHEAKWYDFTGSPIKPEELQFGIGMDRIRSIDDPMFVSPDDPRLLALRHSPYRRDEKPTTNNEIPVIGYTDGADVRAYPVALLDAHEFVNDTLGGKPITVGW